jgi:hypothetical protein
MKDMQNLMRQAQAMQAKLEEARKKLESMEVEGQSGGGMVKLRLSGKHHLLGLSIDRSAVDPAEVDVLEDLIKAAHEDARRKLEQAQNDEMQQVSGGLGGVLPGFKLPF